MSLLANSCELIYNSKDYDEDSKDNLVICEFKTDVKGEDILANLKTINAYLKSIDEPALSENDANFPPRLYLTSDFNDNVLVLDVFENPCIMLFLGPEDNTVIDVEDLSEDEMLKLWSMIESKDYTSLADKIRKYYNQFMRGLLDGSLDK